MTDTYARRWIVGWYRLPGLVNGWWLATAIWVAEHLRGDTELCLRGGNFIIPGWGHGAIRLSKKLRLTGEAEILSGGRDD